VRDHKATRVTVRWSRYGVDAGFRPKLVEARNLGLPSQHFLHVPTAANRLRRNIFSKLQRSASVPPATSTLPSPLLRSRHRPPLHLGPSYRHDRTLTNE